MSDIAPPGTLFHIGYVVPNLDRALAYFNDRLGAPRFMAFREVPVENATFRGSPAAISHSMAFGYVGDMQIEVIEPLSGHSTYAEFLNRVPAGGVHHLADRVDDYDRAVSALEMRGYTLVQSGTFGRTRFGYFEAGDDIGTVTEIVHLDADTVAIFERIRTQAF